MPYIFDLCFDPMTLASLILLFPGGPDKLGITTKTFYYPIKEKIVFKDNDPGP